MRRIAAVYTFDFAHRQSRIDSSQVIPTMVEIRPFRGIRYTAASHGRDLGDYLSPPFDMITPQVERELLQRSDHNVVRLELAPREVSDRYRYVAETQQLWEAEGVLMRDAEPSVYITEETFEYGGERQTRNGFIAAVRLEEYDRGIIFPHEQTRHSWVDDRVRMMGAARAALSPLLVVFQDDIRDSVGGILRAVTGRPPLETATMAGGYTLRLWQLRDPGTLQVLHDLMRSAPLFIADGHHRYEAAMRYRSNVRAQREIHPDEAINFRMMHIVSIAEPGLLMRGYHRVIHDADPAELRSLTRRLRERCRLEIPPTLPPGHPRDWSTADFVAAVGTKSEADEMVFGVYGMNRESSFHLARVKPSPSPSTPTATAASALERSDYHRLHRDLLEPIFPADRAEATVDFDYEATNVVARVDAGTAQLGIIMRAMPMKDFVEVVTRGDRLPPKATNFHPKPPAGAVIQSLVGRL